MTLSISRRAGIFSLLSPSRSLAVAPTAQGRCLTPPPVTFLRYSTPRRRATPSPQPRISAPPRRPFSASPIHRYRRPTVPRWLRTTPLLRLPPTSSSSQPIPMWSSRLPASPSPLPWRTLARREPPRARWLRRYISRCHQRSCTRPSTLSTRPLPRAEKASLVLMAAPCACASSTPRGPRQTYSFKSDFFAILAENYGAGVNLLDFLNAPETSRLTINAWVAAQTDNKIQDLLPPTPSITP